MAQKKSFKEFMAKIGKLIAKPFVIVALAVAKFFTDFWKNVCSKKFVTLVTMQLKDKWNISFKSNKKGAIFKAISLVVVFAAIVAISYVIMNLLSSRLHIFISATVPITAMVVVITVLTLFEGVSILIGLTKALYFGKDNSVLITYPVTADAMFASKMTVYLFDAFKKAFTLIVPILFAFAIQKGYPIYFYFFLLVAVMVYMTFVVCVCGLLSIPTYYILKFLKSFKVVKVIFSFAIVGLLIFATIKILNVIPTNINIVREYQKFSQGLNLFLGSFSKKLPIMAKITALFCGVKQGMGSKAMSGTSAAVLGLLIISIIVLAIIDMVIAKPFYTRMISTSNNFRGKQRKHRNNSRANKPLSVLKYETLRIFRDEKLVVSTIICVVVAPLLILVLNRFYAAFSVSSLGRQLINVFNFFFILLISTSHNISSSYIYSKDGPSWNINKTIPVNPKLSLSLRLVYNFVASLFIIIPASIIFINRSRFMTNDAYFIIIALILLTTFHNVLSASYDFMNSEGKDKADIGSEIVSKHEMISIAYSLILCAAISFLAFIMFRTASAHVFLRITIIGVLLLALEIYLFFKRIRATYQEN